MTGPQGPHGTAAPRRPTEVKVALQDQRDRHLASRRRWDLRLLFLLACVAAAWLLPRVAWRLTPARPAALVIVDKTVPRRDWREHGGLTWWLEHARRLTPAGTPWDAQRDYAGWDPVAGREVPLDSARLAGARLVYVADAYGVYDADFATGLDALERTRRRTGGVTLDEARRLAAFRARGGAVVAEFNTLESPTAGTPAAGVLEATLGARYLRWLGRWYRDLASEDEIPRWMRARWRSRTGQAWAFTGSGVVLFGEDDARLVVLTADRFTGPAPVTLALDAPGDPLVRGVRDGAPYRYWMAGIAPTDSGRVLASWTLHVDDEGRRQLAAEGFPVRFPAIVRHVRPPLAAYVAADLAELQGDPAGRRTRGLDGWLAWWARHDGDAESTLRDVALPLWAGMAREAGM